MFQNNHLIGFGASNSETIFGTVMGPLTLATSAASGLANFTIKETVLIGALSPPSGLVSKVRLTLKAGSVDTPIAKCYIGPRLGSGDTYDVSSFTQILFGGSASVTIPATTSVVSDEASFVWNKTDGLVCSAYLATVGAYSSTTGLGSNYSDREQAGDEAATTNGTSGAVNTGSFIIFQKIETNGF